MTSLDLIHAIDPRVLERARRLEAAIKLLQAGHSLRESRGLIIRQFHVDRTQAWRIVDMAVDMAGTVEAKK